MKSMTGYGISKTETCGLTIRVELRSWNHKGLDIMMRIPNSCNDLEMELKEILSKEAVRGKILVSLDLKVMSGEQQCVFDETKLKFVLERFNEFCRENNLQSTVSLSDILQIPGALEISEELDQDAHLKIIDLFKQTIGRWEQTRITEGQKMKNAISEQCSNIAASLNSIDSLRKEIVDSIRARLSKRISELISELNVKIEEKRLEFEIAMLAEKTDIEEEVVRLRAHIDSLTKLMNDEKKSCIGSELGFILQEMLRETNTIASKCQDLGITQEVISMKTNIERMREIAANVV